MKKLVIVLLTVVLLLSCAGCTVPNSTEEYDNNNLPSIDFMQPWAFCTKSAEELQVHFAKLVNKGIDTVIIQNTAKYFNGDPVVCYFDSQYDFPKKYPDFFRNVMSAASNVGVKIVVGTCFDDYWWKYLVHSYNSGLMDMLYEEEVKLLDEILSNYDVDGVYYANEMFSNPMGYEKRWSAHINKICQYLNSNAPDLSLYISPYTSSAFWQSNSGVVRMWKRFFSNTDLREVDLIILQDGFGNLPSNPSAKQCEKVYNLDKQIRDVCLQYSQADFALNIELFAQDGYASMDRIRLQTEYANKLGNVIACFTVSQYFVDSEQWL